MLVSLTMVRCGGSSKNQVGNLVSILQGILLCNESPKASSAYNRLLASEEVLSQALNIVDNLRECVGLGAGALSMATKVERDHAKAIVELTINVIV